jgi:hypothetical protein
MTYCLRSQNSNYFVRYKDGTAYIYYREFQPNPPSDECGIDLRFLCYDFYYSIYYNTDWSSSQCDNIYTHDISLPYTPYVWPNVLSPAPASASGLLCHKNYPYNQDTVRISNRIKITIYDDPIFSGIYVYDGTGPGDWALNSALSHNNINTYNDIYDLNIKFIQTRDPLTWDPEYDPYSTLPAYFEGLYDTQNLVNPDPACSSPYEQTWELMDSYAFPASFVLTALQNAHQNEDDTYNAGHRLSLGFTLPVRYRKSYRDWIVVDKVPHAITGYTNYSHPVVVDNCYSYMNFDFAEYGTIFPSNTYNGNITGLKCSGINQFGFAFRVTSNLLGRTNYQSSVENYPTAYLDSHLLIRSDGIDTETGESIRDWGNAFFEPKTPVNASVEFVYSCRPGLPCFNLTPSVISPATGTEIGCIVDYYTAINIDYLCGEYDGKPDDAYWINNNIISTNIIYSGISGLLPTLYKYGGGESTANVVYEAYITNDENPIISIPYTGYSKPSSVRNWINSELRLVYFDQDANGNLDINNISSTNPMVDLYWNINGNSATAYIVPSDEDAYTSIAPQLMLINAGTSDVNGKYIWDKYSNQFYQQPNNGFSIRLSYDLNNTTNNYDYGWRVGRLDINTNDWVPYYKVSGSINLLDRTNLYYINSNWIIPDNCYSGLYPPPNSITDPSGNNKYIYVSGAEPILNGYYYLNTQTGFWTSIQNPNAQIRLIDSNYFIGIVSNNIYNTYYMLYNGYSQFLGSELIYYGNKTGNTLSLNKDAHPNCILDRLPPETITIKPFPIGTGLATLRFWRNIYSTCNSVDGTGVANQTINISCASGSIGVNNDTLNAGSSKIYNTIPFDSANGAVTTSNAGVNNLIFIQGLTTDAAFSGNAILDWNNNRDHDLYGQLTLSSYIGQFNSSSPVGVWISNGSYLGTGNPISQIERF